MAVKNISDYLSPLLPEKDELLSIHPTIPPVVNIPESALKKDIILEMDDGAEERVSYAAFIFEISISWNSLRATDAGTLLDFYCDPTKANGMANSFAYEHYDGNKYVVRFDSDFKRDRIFAGDTYRIQPIKLRVLGNYVEDEMLWEDIVDDTILWEDVVEDTMLW